MNLTDQNIIQIFQVILMLVIIFITLNILVALYRYIKLLPKLGLLKYLKVDSYPEKQTMTSILKKYYLNKKK